MKTRYLLSMLAALACPAMASAQAPGPGPDAPPPPDHRDGHPPGNRAFGPSNGRPEESHHQWGGHRHRHSARQQMGESRENGQPGDLRERLVHIIEAAHHLRAAGMNEEADRLENQARRMHEAFAKNRGDGPQEPRGPGMQGRPERGNFAAPQGAYDVRAQLERVMRDVQELRMELRKMRAGSGDGRPDGAGPRGMRPQMNNQAGPEGEHHHGEHHRGDGGNQQPGNDRPPGPGREHRDGANQPGPQGQREPLPRPEWRDHDNANGERGGRGEHHDGARPSAPQGNRPPGSPANEGTIEDLVPIPPALGS